MGAKNPKNRYDWEGIDLQVIATNTPAEDEREMEIYLYCVQCDSMKPFKITQALGDFFVRKSKFVEVGSMCMTCFRKARVEIDWKKLTSLDNLKKSK